MSKKFYIKERFNPQLGTYFVKCGQMTKAEAKRAGNCLYGNNVMHAFDTSDAYEDKITEIMRSGEKLQ